MHTISVTVNGTPHEVTVEARRTLADMLRHDLGYTGTHLGCEHGSCGACTVLLDGQPVRSCLIFGVQADGCAVSTVEGLADGDELTDLQQAFSDFHALQCGFCTPGFLMLAEAYLAEASVDDEAQARELVASNLCRCTGYQGIVEAVLATARARAGRSRLPRTDRRAMYVSKTDLVAALVRELIITGELAAGEQLRQRDLAQRFGVSQTPVREAMRRLESEGMLQSDTHRGFTVTIPADGPVEENLQIRAALESLGAALAARKIDTAGLDRLHELNERMRALPDDDPAYPELNRDFHFTVYEYAGSPLLLSLMRLLWAALHGGLKASRSRAESARQHDLILGALRAGDATAAAGTTREHILGAR